MIATLKSAFLALLVLPALAEAGLSESYGRLPLHFEENRGQAHSDVRFLARGAGYSLYLTAAEAVLVLAKPSVDAERDEYGTPKQQAQVESVALRMAIIGANSESVVSGRDELPGKANYFIGNDPSKWRANVRTYAKVRYREVYPGIDLVYYGNQRQLEYDFVVAPGADPRKIVLGFEGVDKLEIDAQGDLLLDVVEGAIRLRKPVIYQEIDGVRHEIEGRYVVRGVNQVGFQLVTYDVGRALVIDPVIVYSTYLGGSNSSSGSGFERAWAIAADAQGNAYVTGITSSSDFPVTAGAYQTTFAGQPFTFSGDAFVTKLDPSGSALVYSTYLGGREMDDGKGIAVDAGGNAYVTGWTSSTDFPTTHGAFQPVVFGSSILDAFVTKLDPSGSAVLYSTYLGGTDRDGGNAVKVDSAGNAYVTGATDSTDFPTTLSALQPVFAGGTADAFVTKLNPTGSALLYSSYLGGLDYDVGLALTVDSDRNVYVTGITVSLNFPTYPGTLQPIFGGGDSDAFVAKVDPSRLSLYSLVYSSFLGGTGNDWGVGVAVDIAGNAYVAGATDSADFPTTPGTAQPAYGGGSSDAFVSKLDPIGSALRYSTYLGGSNDEVAYGIAVDARGNVWLAGRTASPDFPATQGAFQPAYGGGRFDSFVAKLDAVGSAVDYSTYLGGSNEDHGSAIAVDAVGNAYATGWTGFTQYCPTNCPNDFPTTAESFQPVYGGGYFDAFVVKIAP